MKIYYIHIKQKGQKGPPPLATIANSEKERDAIVQYLLDQEKDVDVKEKDTESFAEFKKRMDLTIEREKLIEQAKKKISPEELQALLEAAKQEK